MEGILRRDGYHVFYILEHQWEKKNTWKPSNLGGIFTKNIPRELRCVGDPALGKSREPFRSFTASGRCWQELGVHGTYDFQTANALLMLLEEYNPAHNFRVVRVTVEQDRVPIESLETWET